MSLSAFYSFSIDYNIAMVTGSSNTSNQLEAGSIIVRHIKSISVPDLSHKTNKDFGGESYKLLFW